MNKYVWLAIGLAAGSGAMLAAELVLIKSMPPELRYRPVQTHPEPVRAPINLTPTRPLVFSYAEGWKDGVVLEAPPSIRDRVVPDPSIAPWNPGPNATHRAELPHNNVPEPGALAMIALPLAWLMRRKS